MGILGVTFCNRSGASERKQEFTCSPLRIGRHARNDLVLDDKLVSEWHAVVSTNAGLVTYVDLGSTNGSTVDGVEVVSHAPVSLSPTSSVVIGSNRLSFSVGEANGSTPHHLAPGNSDDAKTTLFAEGQRAVPAAPGGPPAVSPQDCPPTGVGQHFELALQMSLRIAHLVEGYSTARDRLSESLRHELEQVDVALRPAVARTLATLQPELGYPAVVQQGTLQPSAAQHPVGMAQDRNATPPHNVGRERRLLENFAQAFIELRQCRKLLCDDLGIKGQSNTIIDGFETAQQLLDYLLADAGEWGNPSVQLTEAFANQAAHQIGVVTGVMAGVRSILNRLSPGEVAGHVLGSTAGENVAKPGGDLFSLLIPFRAASLWRRYSEWHDDALREDRFVEELFGERFSEAYRAVVKEGQPTGPPAGADGAGSR